MLPALDARRPQPDSTPVPSRALAWSNARREMRVSIGAGLCPFVLPVRTISGGCKWGDRLGAEATAVEDRRLIQEELAPMTVTKHSGDVLNTA